MIKIGFKSNKRANKYKVRKTIGTGNQTFVVFEEYSSFQEYSEAITQALNTKEVEIEIKGGKTVNIITKAYELYDYILFTEYNSLADLTEYKQVFMNNPRIAFRDDCLIYLDDGRKRIEYPLLNYRRCLALATQVLKGEKSMDILVKFINNHADRDLDGLIFPTMGKNATELVAKICKILGLAEIPEPDSYLR